MSDDEGVRAYMEAISPEQRPLFDRMHEIVLGEHPDAEVALSYGMPAYRVGKRRLNLGVWKHGVSVYGWRADRDGGFVAAPPAVVEREGDDTDQDRGRGADLRRRATGAARWRARAVGVVTEGSLLSPAR